MGLIDEYVAKIRAARYGKDVRDSIANALTEMDEIAETAQDSALNSANKASASEIKAKTYADEAKMHGHVGQAIISIKQGDEVKGSFTFNDDDSQVIELEDGGSGANVGYTYVTAENINQGFEIIDTVDGFARIIYNTRNFVNIADASGTLSNSVTYRIYDGNVELDGTGNGNFSELTLGTAKLNPGKYVMTGMEPSDTADNTLKLYDSSGTEIAYTYSGKQIFTITTYGTYTLKLRVDGSTTYDNETYTPIITDDITIGDTTFVPFEYEITTTSKANPSNSDTFVYRAVNSNTIEYIKTYDGGTIISCDYVAKLIVMLPTTEVSADLMYADESFRQHIYPRIRDTFAIGSATKPYKQIVSNSFHVLPAGISNYPAVQLYYESRSKTGNVLIGSPSNKLGILGRLILNTGQTTGATIIEPQTTMSDITLKLPNKNGTIALADWTHYGTIIWKNTSAINFDKSANEILLVTYPNGPTYPHVEVPVLIQLGTLPVYSSTEVSAYYGNTVYTGANEISSASYKLTKKTSETSLVYDIVLAYFQHKNTNYTEHGVTRVYYR